MPFTPEELEAMRLADEEGYVRNWVMICVICERLGMTVEGARANHFITCPAYRDETGKRLLVHQGHCTGAFGVDPCKHYIGSDPKRSSVCWCELERTIAQRKEEVKRK